jgi:hypothetical protein
MNPNRWRSEWDHAQKVFPTLKGANLIGLWISPLEGGGTAFRQTVSSNFLSNLADKSALVGCVLCVQTTLRSCTGIFGTISSPFWKDATEIGRGPLIFQEVKLGAIVRILPGCFKSTFHRLINADKVFGTHRHVARPIGQGHRSCTRRRPLRYTTSCSPHCRAARLTCSRPTS